MKTIETQKAIMDSDLVEIERSKRKRRVERDKLVLQREREKEEELVTRTREVKKGEPIKNKRECVKDFQISGL